MQRHRMKASHDAVTTGDGMPSRRSAVSTNTSGGIARLFKIDHLGARRISGIGQLTDEQF
jgi:hypothetical protein